MFKWIFFIIFFLYNLLLIFLIILCIYFVTLSEVYISNYKTGENKQKKKALWIICHCRLYIGKFGTFFFLSFKIILMKNSYFSVVKCYPELGKHYKIFIINIFNLLEILNLNSRF